MPVAEFKLEGAEEGTILVEVDDEGRGLVRVAHGGTDVLQSEKSFEQATKVLQPIANAVRRAAAAMRPDECEVELGLKLTGQLGVIVAKQSSEAHLKVKLKWVAAPQKGDTPLPVTTETKA